MVTESIVGANPIFLPFLVFLLGLYSKQHPLKPKYPLAIIDISMFSKFFILHLMFLILKLVSGKESLIKITGKTELEII